MPICPNCHTSSPDVYVGFSTVECINPECRSYKPKRGDLLGQKEDREETKPTKDNVPLEKVPTEDDGDDGDDGYILSESEDYRILDFYAIQKITFKYSYNLESYNLPS